MGDGLENGRRKLGGKIEYHVMQSRLELRGRKDVDGSIRLRIRTSIIYDNLLQ
jgi:hypothetical protein